MPETMIPTESLKFTEARPKLSELLNRVFRRETRIRLYKGAIPVAAIVSIDDLERLEMYDRDRAAAFEAMQRVSEKFSGVSTEELENELDQAVAGVIAERRAAVAD